MRLRRSTISPKRAARVADVLGFHWSGSRPALVDDLSLTDSVPRRDFTDSHDISKSGSPDAAQPIGETDDPSYDFDGSSDSLSVADDASLDATGSDDLAVIALVQRSSTSSAETICQKWSGTVGYRLRLQSDGTVDFIIDDGSNQDTVSSSTAIDDGATRLVTASIDRGGSQITIEVDGTREGTTSTSAGDISNASDFVVADSSFSGVVGAIDVHGTWITEPQSAFLDSLLRTSDVAPGTWGRLRSLIYGSPETGWQRRLPSYLTDAFGADGPDFWWSADRQIRHVDGEGTTQLSNHSGSGFFVQRNDSYKGIARKSGIRGAPTERVESNANNEHMKARNSPSAPDKKTVAVVYENSDVSTTAAIWGSSDLNVNARRFLDCRQGTLGFYIEDDSGTIVDLRNGLAYNNNEIAVLVAWHDLTNDRYGFTFKSSTGSQTQTSTKTLGSVTSQKAECFLDYQVGGSAVTFNGFLHECLHDRSKVVTASEAETLRDDLYNKYT